MDIQKIHGWAIIGAEALDTDMDMVFGSVLSHIRLTLTLYLLINKIRCIGPSARMIAHSEAALRLIRKLQLPSLSITTRLDIIELGIKKQPIHHPYCWSKAGHKLFHCIKEVMNNHPSNIRERGITLSNLSEIKLEPKSKFTHSFVNISHVNARSISNKIIPFQQESVMKKLTYVP